MLEIKLVDTNTNEKVLDRIKLRKENIVQESQEKGKNYDEWTQVETWMDIVEGEVEKRRKMRIYSPDDDGYGMSNF